MKRTALIATAAALVLSCSVSALAVRQSVSANAAHGTPIIDGKLDDAYLGSDKISVKNFANFANSGAEEHLPNMATGEGYILWDEANLYYHFTIKDATPIKESFESGSTDAVEMGFDFENTNSDEARPTSYGDNGMFLKTAPYARALGFADGEVLWVEGFSAWLDELKEDIKYKVSTAIISGGYVVEAKLPLSDAVKAMFKAGYSFGYAISILDDVDDDGKRDMKITWGANDGDIQAANMLNTSASCDKVVLVAKK